MASVSQNDLVTIACTNTNSVEAPGSEILISTLDILNWDISSILRYQTVNIHSHKHCLVEKSSYFSSFFSGEFRDTNSDQVLIEWNLYGFLNMLKCIYGCEILISSSNFLLLIETALYFGVDILLSKCKKWFSDVLSSKESTYLQLQLDDLVHIWDFGLQHASDFLPEMCACYLARNFVGAMSDQLFGEVPHDLLLCCLKHPDLTVNSEMCLTEAILLWLDINAKHLELSSEDGNGVFGILNQIKIRLLPLSFVAGKRRLDYFSQLANESIANIFGLLKIQSIDFLLDGNLHHIKIRLTDYSKEVSLSGCPQMSLEMLFLSLIPSEYGTNQKFSKDIKDLIVDLKCFGKDQRLMLRRSLPLLSFEAVEEMDIYKCPSLQLRAAIICFSKSFPSLRKLKATYFSNFNISILNKLMLKCPRISEVDFTVNLSPLIPSAVSIKYPSSGTTTLISLESLRNSLFDMTPSFSERSILGITKLILEGRNEILDSDILLIASYCNCLQYINLKGCVSLTDFWIAELIQRCANLHSILVCETSFGMKSVTALCSVPRITSEVLDPRIKNIKDMPADSLACRLQILHMGGCKGVDTNSLAKLLSQSQSLNSLCLRGTQLNDNALYSFPGSSLEILDVSDTMISGAALAHTVRRNTALKTLKARDCKNLVQQENNTNRMGIYRELYTELGKNCTLEEIAFGWGFSCFSLQDVKPAFTSLKTIIIGLGGSLGEEALQQLLTTCPHLKTIELYFQKISDSIMINIASSLKHLEALSLCYCYDELSLSSFNHPIPSLKKLTLKRVTPFMTNEDLVLLTRNCPNLVELSLFGCKHLDSDSLNIICTGWPGLVSLHLEECGKITEKGVTSLFDCVALEELTLRHNGPGIERNFICDAVCKFPLLRQISLDSCDTCEGHFNIPTLCYRDTSDINYSLRTLKIARCKFPSFALRIGAPPHKDTVVFEWSSLGCTTTTVKERL